MFLFFIFSVFGSTFSASTTKIFDSSCSSIDYFLNSYNSNIKQYINIIPLKSDCEITNYEILRENEIKIYKSQIYDFIHNFRLRLNSENPQTHTVSEVEPRNPGILPGKLGDAFFEPLPEEELQEWE